MACSSQDLWVGGQGGYHTYRIPALTVTASGTVLAFCEGRVHDASDGGRKDLLVRRSTDGGRNWSDQAVVYAEPASPDPEVDLHAATAVAGDVAQRRGDSVGNPTVVVDEKTGRIIVLFIRHVTTLFVSHSDDDGQTWSEPRDITDQVQKPGTNVVPGPGAGIQIQRGTYAGRLVMPCYYRPVKVDPPAERPVSAVLSLISDDAGQSWRAGSAGDPGGNECQVVELGDGRLMMNMRMQLFGQGCRGIAYSQDGGESWGDVIHDANLPDPVCQASLIRLRAGSDDGDRLLFANPADSATAYSAKQRRQLTVRLSEDGGQSWQTSRLLEPGRAAYSALAERPDGTFLCLYETGTDAYYEKLRLASFDLDWLAARS